MNKLLKNIFLFICIIPFIALSCSSSDEPEINGGGGDSTEIVPQGVDTYGYIKDTEGKPVVGVVVSDGFSCVTTDETGLYKFNRNKDARHVKYSLPADYEVDLHPNYKLPQSYSKLQANTTKYNFKLKKLEAPETRFDLVCIGDPQVTTTGDIERFKSEVMADLQKYVSSASVPCYGITLGDHVNNKWALFGNLVTTMRHDVGGLPIFPTVGNHDFEFPKATEAESLSKYESFFGPTDYSFNRGNVHVVSMNNILHKYTASPDYDGGFTKERFEWLKKDLSYVPKDKMVILCVHIPIRNQSYPYYTEVLDLLAEYKYATIMSAHTHSNYKYIHNIKGKEIVEHITGTTCGAWWRSTVCTEGTPIGLGIFRIDGTDIKEWTYKAIKHDEDFQIRLYRASDVFTGGGSASYQFSYKGEDQIVANIWNWDPKWEVNVYEDGIKTGSMSRFSGQDAWTGAYHVGVLGGNSSYNKSTDHLFYYTLKNSNAKVKVEAIDRFGKKYEQTVFVDPTSNPKSFHTDY